VTLINRRTVTIEWGDCDSAGIVFYPRYFAMFDWSTAMLFAHALGMRKPEIVRRYGIVGIPMVDTRAKFLVPSSYGDEVVIESRVEKFGRASFEVYHRLLKEENLAAECWEKRVWVARHPDDATRIKAVPIPEEVIARFEAAG
jgi:4-hydroxybenzoyl-CoA thioesterase